MQRKKHLDEKFCEDCGSIIKLKAEICPTCGVRIQNTEKGIRIGTYWIPVPSFILGLLALLASLDDPGWDYDTFVGFATFIFASLIFGFVGMSIQETGKVLSILGIVFSVLSLFLVVFREI